jgi:hypothetical protein
MSNQRDDDVRQDDFDAPIWGAAAIAAVLGVPLHRANYLLAQQRLDATKVGRSWVSSRRRLLRSVGIEV